MKPSMLIVMLILALITGSNAVLAADQRKYTGGRFSMDLEGIDRTKAPGRDFGKKGAVLQNTPLGRIRIAPPPPPIMGN